ncbi:flavin reductase family protein [Marivivens donghaensis]|uniref:Flavin reductase family protein n=1 Tax=Marivivens donghaensis TaxID=1699413 RepID=A0ABX0VVB9_9RHOB|nr:flavin reductase family protein [Marivivens donghaensis]NIY72014.1 flavin reductase family protein [Marivivens donghaensis]
MFYKPTEGHGLPHNPFSAIVSPRPIGWISTRGNNGLDNLAPYSFFNAVAYEPPQVMFAANGSKADRDFGKDTLSNIRETGVFCINIVDYASRDLMNATSASHPAHVNEFEAAGIDHMECETIPCGRVAKAPASLECRMTQIVQLEGKSSHAVFGEVIGIHMRDDCVIDGVFDVTTFQPLSRLGYRDYAVVKEVFSLTRPDDKK